MTREKAIENILRKIIKSYRAEHSVCPFPGCGCIECLAGQALALLKPAEWINFADKMPEKGFQVLVMADGNKEYTYPRYYIGSYNGRKDDKQNWLLALPDDAAEFEFTHWMPLPEPIYNRHTAEIKALDKKPAVCETCKGRELIPCNYCRGSGYLPNSNECDICKGNGEIPCPDCKPAPTGQAVKKAIELKPCPFCSEEQKQVTEVVEVLLTIVKYQEDALFLSNFILGDWQDLPLEVKQLIKKLKLKVWNKRAVLEKPAPTGQEAGEFTKMDIDNISQFDPEQVIVDKLFIHIRSCYAHIDRLEVELKQQYDKGFLEGTEAQEEANRKHIIEPLAAEKKRLKDAMSEIGGISNLGQSPDTKSFEDMIVRLNKIWQIVWDLSKP